MTLVEETGFRRDVRHRHVRVHEASSRLLEAQGAQIFAGRTPIVRSKRARHMRLCDRRCVGEHRDVDRPLIALVQ